MQGIDAVKQGRIHINGVVVRGLTGRHLALYRLQLRRGFAGGQVVKQQIDAAAQAPALIERLQGVGKAGGAGVVGNGVNFSQVGGQRHVKRGQKVTGLDGGERRQPVGAAPVRQQGVGAWGVRGHEAVLRQI